MDGRTIDLGDRMRVGAILFSMIPNDTHPKAEAKQLDLIREAGFARRGKLALSMSEQVIGYSRQELRRHYPQWSEEELLLQWILIHYGEDLQKRVRSYLISRNA